MAMTHDTLQNDEIMYDSTMTQTLRVIALFCLVCFGLSYLVDWIKDESNVINAH